MSTDFSRISDLARSLKMRELHYLVSIADLGSLRKAAAANNISQPALSRIVHDIEQILRVRLFERVSNRTVATPYGEIFVTEARQMLASVTSMHHKIDRLRHRGRHVYQLGAAPSPAVRLIPEAFMRTRDKYPDFAVQVSEEHSELLIAGLHQRRYELVIARTMSPELVGPLSGTVLYDETGVVIARGGHPLFSRPSIRFDDAHPFPWILPPAGPTLTAIEHSFITVGLRPPEACFVNYSIVTISELLAMSDALTILSPGVVRPLLMSGQFRVVPLGIDIRLPAYALYHWPAGLNDPVLNHLRSELITIADATRQQGGIPA